MTDEEKFEKLIGIWAYDDGCVDSGIKDEELRSELIDWLPSLDYRTISTFIREHFLSEEALDLQYGIADVAEFIRWLDENMGYSL